MARPTPVQVVQMGVLGVLVFVGLNVAFGLIAFGFTVVTGMWAG